MPRSRRWWQERLRLMGVVVLGTLAGIIVGLLLVHLIIGRWGQI